jgi:RND superfamily putative drug exporter
VAVTAPLSYDFYQQLPPGQGASQGLTALDQHFGPGDAFPMEVLVTFPAPLLISTTPNASEFVELSQITTAINGTSGVASVQSLVGPGGAPLSAWLGYAAALHGTQAELSGTFGEYVGVDGRTVLLTVVPASSGLSASAVALLTHLQSVVPASIAGDPDPGSVQVEYGGGASVTADLAAQTALATERMFIAVCIGLAIVLFVVLRSALIPPMAIATIALSIGWAWGATQVLFAKIFALPLFFFVPTVLFILILGLGIDYNIFLLTRVREERLRGRTSQEAVLEGITRTGGIITAAAIILAAAFAALGAGDFLLLRAIGFAVATAVILDALVVRTYLVPASLQLLGDRVWHLRSATSAGPPLPPAPEPPP